VGVQARQPEVQRLQRILETHQPEPLSPIAQQQIAAILLEIAVQ